MADDLPKPDDPITKKIRKLRDLNLPSWRRRRRAIEELRAFIAGDRYKNNVDQYNKDRRLVQIKGQEIQDTTRHIMGETTKRPRSVEARPIDQDTDPDAAELAVSLIEWELGDPWKGFDDELEAAILACRQSRAGLVWLDWEPDKGPYGELLYRYGDAKRVMWDDAYPDPHHPMCEWVIEEYRTDLQKARDQYDAPWLTSDREIAAARTSADQPILPNTFDDLVAQAYRDDKVTLLRYWAKNDSTPSDKTKPGDFIPFKSPDENYLACQGMTGDGCGYRSETQGELNDQVEEGEEPHTLPTEMTQGCPTCGGDLHLVEGKVQQHEVRAYSQGKRLVVMPAYQTSPDDEPLADGNWPIPTLRSFPLFLITAYQSPGEPMGPCDTDLMWDQQIADDQLATMILERVYEHRNYYEMPKVGITDAKDNRFEFRDDQFNIMFRDDSVEELRNRAAVQIHSGSGLDPMAPFAYQTIHEKLTARTGVLDMGLTQENSKDIPASTVAQLTQQQNIPISHFIRRLHRALSKFYGVLWDAIRYTYTSQRLARLRIDDQDIVAPLSGDDLPNFDFVIEEAPEFTGLEKARQQAWDQAMQMLQAGAPPEIIEAWGQFHSIPRTVIRKLLKVITAQQQQQAEQGMGGPTGSLPPEPSPGQGGMGPPQNAGQETPGMVPGAAA